MKTGSWKTTITGILTVAAALAGLALKFFNGEAISSAEITVAAGAIAGGIGLITARDDDKTSEETGAKTWAAERNSAAEPEQDVQ
ncbi:MAG TPA: hypothetical protein VF692_03605 [Pyrinomonadaceae bacterium]|jgi:hypothetical protein